jgi:hypothetical protein
MNISEMMNEYRAAINDLAVLNQREKDEQGTCAWGFWDDVASREKEQTIEYFRTKLREMEIDPDAQEEGDAKRKRS